MPSVYRLRMSGNFKKVWWYLTWWYIYIYIWKKIQTCINVLARFAFQLFISFIMCVWSESGGKVKVIYRWHQSFGKRFIKTTEYASNSSGWCNYLPQKFSIKKKKKRGRRDVRVYHLVEFYSQLAAPEICSQAVLSKLECCPFVLLPIFKWGIHGLSVYTAMSFLM